MKEIVLDYLRLKSDVSSLIKKSGYKSNFIAERIGMVPTNFSMKRQRANWTDKEMLGILDVIENDDLEDFYLGKLMSEMKEKEFTSLSDFKKELNR
jgi:hypothetical protein